MATFNEETTINAPIKDVWRVLADIGTISQWNPGVMESYVNTDQTTGVGAGRYCDLGGKNYLDETVVAWEENRALTMRIIGTNLPFKTADIRFTLRDEGDSTVVTVSPEYQLKFGPIGKAMDAMFVRRTYTNGMAKLLAGLKEHVEQQAS
ncbi:MAG: SRPBCC family protein [Chloroflexota bacterium]